MAESGSHFTAGGFHINIARCEQCAGDVLYLQWPVGWVRTGRSKYKTEYCKDGIAWWCPECKATVMEGKGDTANG